VPLHRSERDGLAQRQGQQQSNRPQDDGGTKSAVKSKWVRMMSPRTPPTATGSTADTPKRAKPSVRRSSGMMSAASVKIEAKSSASLNP
jgi:hypothetical protein